MWVYHISPTPPPPALSLSGGAGSFPPTGKDDPCGREREVARGRGSCTEAHLRRCRQVLVGSAGASWSPMTAGYWGSGWKVD